MSLATIHTVSQTVRCAFTGQSFGSPRVQFRTHALWDIPGAFSPRLIACESAPCFVHVHRCAMRRSVSSLFTFARRRTLLPSRVTNGSFGLHLFLCVHCSLPPRPTLPASLPLTQTAPLCFEGRAADGNVVCSVLVSALHPRSVGVVTDSFRPVVVESGDEPT